MTFDLSLSESAGSRSLDRLVRNSWDDTYNLKLVIEYYLSLSAVLHKGPLGDCRIVTDLLKRIGIVVSPPTDELPGDLGSHVWIWADHPLSLL